MAPFYRNAVHQVVPETEQPGLAFFDRLGLMSETIARRARKNARNCEQNDGGLVLPVFMVQTIRRPDTALCPEQRTSCSGDVWHSSYGWKPARSGAAFCVTATRNDAGESAITRSMNGASVTPLSLTESQNPKVPNRHHLRRTVRVEEREVWGMTLTPPGEASLEEKRRVPGNETAAIPAARS